ncbi:MAG: DUF3466 family protein [Planctomycetes bacterium]|nr:DUF3466 family protein [Planctomycetota bacterium]NOG53625.1 DUF3466 family protein [Planctomycetota bacterium]
MGEYTMRTSNLHCHLGMTVVVLCCASHCIASLHEQYAILDIASGHEPAAGMCVNNSAVCGGWFVFGPLFDEAGVWTQQQGLFPLDLGEVQGSIVLDISNSNQAVGYYWPEIAWQSRAFLYDTSGMVDLGTLGGEEAEANAISDSGVVVGWSYGPGGKRRPFVYRDGVMRRLKTTENEEGQALGINNNDVVVGYKYRWSDSGQLIGNAPCYWTPDGRPHWLATLDKTPSQGGATAVNDANVIVGATSFPNGANMHAVIWEGGRVHDIHAWGSGLGSSSAVSINHHNVVVGHKSNDKFKSAAFVWTQETGMILANLLLPPRSHWDLQSAVDINDLNMIIGRGSRGDVIYRPFLLTPVYPSIDLTEFSPGVSGQMSTIEAQNVPPGATVHFLGARWGGGALITTCDVTKNALQLEDPRQLGTAVADENGVATIQGVIPEKWAGREILFQAFVRETCEISNLVVQTFE